MIQNDQVTGRVAVGRLHPTIPVGGCLRLVMLGNRGATGVQAPLSTAIHNLQGTAVKAGVTHIPLNQKSHLCQ